MTSPIICWVRRDFRLSDNPMLSAAAASGRPVIPVFILDEVAGGFGACPRWRMGLGAEAFAANLGNIGSRLIFKKGNALAVLRGLVQETGAGAVWWARTYDAQSVARDTAVKSALKGDGVEARSFPGHVLFEPWEVETKTGAFYKVYTPYWKMVKDREVPAPLPAVTSLPAPTGWPESEDPATWGLARAMNRGAEIVRPWLNIGEGAAADRLGAFIAGKVGDYRRARDLPAVQGTSRLSENLTYGEISPRSCWHAGIRALNEGKDGAETFLKEIVWREFAHHLAYHTPHITTGNWRPEWDAFPWNTDAATREVRAWQQGRTGMRFVDAAMRELYVTGHMHNRARMIVASYLTKHLMCHWKIGLNWFAECLADWDPASNAMGWQWSAGSGPDATPYFRVFNPVTQLDKFDAQRTYVDTWIAEGKANPAREALQFFDAIPRNWSISADDAYPEPIVAADEGRKRALAAYERRDF